MKAEINESGILTVYPENETELYAIDKWFEKHKNGCSYIMNPLDLRKDIGFELRPSSEVTPISIIKDKELSKEGKVALLNTLFKDKFTMADAERVVSACAKWVNDAN